MKRAFQFASLLLLWQAAPLSAKPTDEWLANPPLHGFAESRSETKGAMSVREEIPTGETRKNWTKMVTTQRFSGLAKRMKPKEFAQEMLDNMSRICPDGTASAIKSLKVSGRKAVRLDITCPTGRDHMNETSMLLAIAGKRDMHVKQFAFRARRTSETLSWGREFLRNVVLCPYGRKPLCK